MESGARRQRGFKGKLVMSFYKAPKPSSTQYSSKVKPAPASTATMGYIADEFPMPSPAVPPMTEKVKILRAVNVGKDFGWYADSDENVDKKAANYISKMQERFRLEQNN